MTKTQRQLWIKQGILTSFKTGCNKSVLDYLGIYESDYRYAQTIDDLVRLIRSKGYYCHSRKSQYKGTVKQVTSKDIKEIGLYLIFVKGHVLLIDYKGNVLVDTHTEYTKGKQIKGIWLIYP